MEIDEHKKAEKWECRTLCAIRMKASTAELKAKHMSVTKACPEGR